MTHYKAVIFDFDGVIADTLEDGCAAWQQACSEFGIEFDRSEFLLAEGRKAEEYITPVLERHGVSTGLVSEIIARKNQIYTKIHTFSFFEGVTDWIAELKALGVKTAVVSGGSRSRLLGGSSGPFLKERDVVVTGDDVTRGKPSPEPFLKAAQHIGLRPEECLVIENAPLGVQAAKAAGMTCIAVCSTLPASALQNADMVFSSVKDVAEAMRSHVGVNPASATRDKEKLAASV